MKLDFRSLTGGTTCQFFLLPSKTSEKKTPNNNNLILAQIMLKKDYL